MQILSENNCLNNKRTKPQFREKLNESIIGGKSRGT